jgi:hypothetical protein
MTSILFRASSGVAGDITRPDNTVVESGLLNAAKAPASFGAPVKLVSGKFEKVEASDAATVFAGIISRLAPSIAGDLAQAFGTGVPNGTAVQGVVVKGYVNVVCAVGTPVRGGQVFMRITADTGKAVGDLETAADTAKCVALTGVTWAVDGKDASNVTEIRIA